MKTMIDALSENNNLVSYALLDTGFTYKQHKEWLLDEDYQLALEELEERKKDFYESKVLQLVNEGSNQVVVNVMKFKLADRGYAKLEEKVGDITDIEIGFE